MSEYEVAWGAYSILVSETFDVTIPEHDAIARWPNGNLQRETTYTDINRITSLHIRLPDGSVATIFENIKSTPYDPTFFLTQGGTIWIYDYAGYTQKLYEHINLSEDYQDPLFRQYDEFFYEVGSLYYFDIATMKLELVSNDVVGGYSVSYGGEKSLAFSDEMVTFWEDPDHKNFIDSGVGTEHTVTRSTDGIFHTLPADLPHGLFTSIDDVVDFNALTPAQLAAIGASPTSINDALGGNDIVHLPNSANYAEVHWDPHTAFNPGPGDDVVVGGDGNDTIRGSSGNDHLYGGTGADTFDYGDINLNTFAANSVETIDGGTHPGGDPVYLTPQPDLLLLPGKSHDYVITTSGLNTKLEYVGPNGPITFNTTGIEQVRFSDQTLNSVLPQTVNLFGEMVRLSIDVYSTGASSLIGGRGWEPLSAIELGLLPAGTTYDGSSYTLTEGYYRAAWSVAQIPHLPDTAVAEVAVGLVNGARTLTLSFEGTVDASDWLYNVVSFGAYYSKYAPLIEAIDRYVGTNGIQQVLVEGHSLGASMVQLFMDTHPGTIYKALTLALPGIALDSGNADDPRTLNLIHTDDPVGNLPLLQQNGTEIYLNSSAPYLGTILHHSSSLYADSFAKLLDFATNPGSPFDGSALGNALVSGSAFLTWGPTDIHAQADDRFQVAVGAPDSTRIISSARDDYVLGGPGDDHIVWRDPLDPTFRIVDASSGTDEVVLPGLKVMWGWAASGTHFSLTEFGSQVGELWHVEKLVFTFGSDVDLTRSSSSLSQLGSASLKASDDGVPVVWLDGRSASVQRPDAADTQLVINSSVDYVDVGNSDIDVVGSAARDIVMLGSGSQKVHGHGGSDVLNGVHSALGSVLEISGDDGDDILIGGAGKDILSGGNGIDWLSGGAGEDVFKDTAAGLSGDTITDFARGDRIVIPDAAFARFTYHLTDNVLTYSGGSVTLSNLHLASIAASLAPEGGVQITFSGPPLIASAGLSVSLAISQSSAAEQTEVAKLAMSAGEADLTPKAKSVDFPIQSGIQWDVSHMAHDPFLFA